MNAILPSYYLVTTPTSRITKFMTKMNGHGSLANGTSTRLEEEEDPAVSRFREYLRIKTVQPNPDYGANTYTSCLLVWW